MQAAKTNTNKCLVSGPLGCRLRPERLQFVFIIIILL